MGEAPLPGLSVFLITLNEADRLGETLAAVSGIASEIIVVDSGSTDATVEVARTGGARVIRERWRGYGPQKRFAEEQCAGPWLLNLDADEFVPPALAAEIRALFAHGEPRHVAYKIQIADQLPDSTAPKRFAYGPSPVRLYRKDAGRYSDSPVHDRVDLRARQLRGAPAPAHPPSLVALAVTPARQDQFLHRCPGRRPGGARQDDRAMAPAGRDAAVVLQVLRDAPAVHSRLLRLHHLGRRRLRPLSARRQIIEWQREHARKQRKT